MAEREVCAGVHWCAYGDSNLTSRATRDRLHRFVPSVISPSMRGPSTGLEVPLPTNHKPSDVEAAPLLPVDHRLENRRTGSSLGRPGHLRLERASSRFNSFKRLTTPARPYTCHTHPPSPAPFRRACSCAGHLRPARASRSRCAARLCGLTPAPAALHPDCGAS
jgi:hypothetical protein